MVIKFGLPLGKPTLSWASTEGQFVCLRYSTHRISATRLRVKGAAKTPGLTQLYIGSQWRNNAAAVLFYKVESSS